MKPFTVIAALVLLIMAAMHAYRAYTGLDLVVAGHAIPIFVSWICTGVAGFLGIALFFEARHS
ncbi:MAG: hypothetical protein KGJ78_02640 [Alphaproteobacteria bacterium]|nr:hypothetical protein [Alphaproteobacteria bacterium]